MDLKRHIETKHAMMNELHWKNLMYQLLAGVAYLHSEKIMHRDLKPPNVMLNEEKDENDESIVRYSLRIGDFGLARTMSLPNNGLTEDVVTRWYKAPELLLGSTVYTYSIDVWACGCIFYEMLTGTPLFPGDNNEEQFGRIVSLLGEIDIEEWPDLQNDAKYPNRNLLASVPVIRNAYVSDEINRLSDDAKDLLECMLKYNPDHRITAEDALNHPYFDEVRDEFQYQNMEV
eukprot:TRINITY_DN1183_c0_g1_i2.p1 TRINITY_DN1183_c0_g1~~TRINITY_DN1183_c0_g1_i2.p1  ORF type:complete len:231 (+),score=55.16 TRINITY_DN1183_c0_g1_i2:337-1029(+)